MIYNIISKHNVLKKEEFYNACKVPEQNNLIRATSIAPNKIQFQGSKTSTGSCLTFGRWKSNGDFHTSFEHFSLPPPNLEVYRMLLPARYEFEWC